MFDNELMKNIIRSILVDLRIEHNLSQTEVGKIVGKSKTAVASWEQGLSMPDAVTLYHLARYYGKSINYMYGEGSKYDR
jgi:transcriptional regulator with XRE-family HTH domain